VSGVETDVECGGVDCGPCESGERCLVAGDCKSGVCHAEKCVSEHVWSARFGDAEDQVGQSVAIDGAGNVFIAGVFKGTADFGGGPLKSAAGGSFFLAKRDAAGNHVWSKAFGEQVGSDLINITVGEKADVAVLCTSNGTINFGGGDLVSVGLDDVFIAKLSSSGEHIWSKSFGTSSIERASAVLVENSGAIIIAGDFDEPISFGGGTLTNADNFFDIFIVKFNSDGDHIWSRSYQSSANLPPFKMATDAAGNITLAGNYFGGNINFGGGPLANAGGHDIYVAKLDSSGNHTWSNRFGDSAAQVLGGVAIDNSGDILVTGSFDGTFDFGGSALVSAGSRDAFIVKLGSTGNFKWGKQFGDASYQSSSAIAVDPSGNVIVAGDFEGVIDFGGGPLASAGASDLFLVELTLSGDHVWSRRYGDQASQSASAVHVDGAGNLVVTGGLQGSADFGGGQLISAGLNDIFVAQLAYP
jgi:hypothetical protein